MTGRMNGESSAHVALAMAAMGVEPPCGCGHLWERGETMYAVERADGEPLGWLCSTCVDEASRRHAGRRDE